MDSKVGRLSYDVRFVDIDGVEHSYPVKKFGYWESFQRDALFTALTGAAKVPVEDTERLAMYGMLCDATVAFQQTTQLDFQTVAGWFDPTDVAHIETLMEIFWIVRTGRREPPEDAAKNAEPAEAESKTSA